jgi:hypothetical protein
MRRAERAKSHDARLNRVPFMTGTCANGVDFEVRMLVRRTTLCTRTARECSPSTAALCSSRRSEMATLLRAVQACHFFNVVTSSPSSIAWQHLEPRLFSCPQGRQVVQVSFSESCRRCLGTSLIWPTVWRNADEESVSSVNLMPHSSAMPPRLIQAFSGSNWETSRVMAQPKGAALTVWRLRVPFSMCRVAKPWGWR